MTNWPLIHALEAQGRIARGRFNFDHARRVYWSGRVALSTRMGHQEARVRAEGLVHKWGTLEGKRAAELHSIAARVHKLRPPTPPSIPTGEGTCVPKTLWNPYRKTLANWVARELADAVAHGAQGHVNSGLRTYAEQARLYWLYQHGGNIAARPGQSNHEGYIYSRGAVDWSDPESLERALHRKAHHRLIWAEDVGLRDTVHFSGSGR